MEDSVETELVRTAQLLAKDLREIESRVASQFENAKDTAEKVAEGISSLRQVLSPSQIIRKNPWACVGGAALLGFVWANRSSPSDRSAVQSQATWRDDFGSEIRSLRNSLLRQAAHFVVDKVVEAAKRKIERDPPQS
jgi:ElaB/YqjD/DUF883 family membrane-anchored ribosome-binding protein